MSDKRIKNNRKNRVGVLVDPGDIAGAADVFSDGTVYFPNNHGVQPVPINTKDLWNYLSNQGCYRKKDPVIVATQLNDVIQKTYDQIVDKTITDTDIPLVKGVVSGLDKALSQIEKRMIAEITELEEQLNYLKSFSTYDPITGKWSISDNEIKNLESRIFDKKTVADNVRDGRNNLRSRFGVKIKGNITWKVTTETLQDIIEETNETCNNGTLVLTTRRTSRYSRKITRTRENVKGFLFVTAMVAGATTMFIIAQLLAAKARGDEVEVARLEQELANLPTDTLEGMLPTDPTDFAGLPVSLALAEGWQMSGPLGDSEWTSDDAQAWQEDVEIIETVGGVCNVCCQSVTLETIRTMLDESKKCAEQTALCPVVLPDGSLTYETLTLIPTVTVITEDDNPEISFDEETCKLKEKYETIIRVTCGCPPADAPCPEFIYCPSVVETPDGCYIIANIPTKPEPSGCGCPELIEPEDILPCYPSPSPSGCDQPDPACGWYPYEMTPGNWGWQLQPCASGCNCDGVNTDPGYDPGYANEYASPITGICI